jgi:hypothetical protein
MLGTWRRISSASSISRSVGAPEREALVHGAVHPPPRPPDAVAEDHRPPRADVVDVALALGIEQVRPFGAGDEARRAADGAERRTGELTPPG